MKGRLSPIVGYLLCGLAVALAACEDPDAKVAMGAKEYRSLPAGSAVSWPSSGTSNGTGCVPPRGNSIAC
jgi:hypothetical protein